jgi:hypothetical protein
VRLTDTLAVEDEDRQSVAEYDTLLDGEAVRL